MTKSFYIIILVVIGLTSCASQKKLQKKTPFIVQEITLYKWSNSIEKSDSGIEIKIPIRQMIEEDIDFKYLYFRGRVAEITTKNSNGSKYLIANFINEKLQKLDIVMHSDSKNEVGNQPPLLNINKEIEFPFQLADDEAVLSYIENNGKKLKYTKLTGIKEK